MCTDTFRSIARAASVVVCRSVHAHISPWASRGKNGIEVDRPRHSYRSDCTVSDGELTWCERAAGE